MAKAKYGNTKAEYAKHLRPSGKRQANKQVRKQGRMQGLHNNT